MGRIDAPDNGGALSAGAQQFRDPRRRVSHRVKGRDEDERVLPLSRIESAGDGNRQPELATGILPSIDVSFQQ